MSTNHHIKTAAFRKHLRLCQNTYTNSIYYHSIQSAIALHYASNIDPLCTVQCGHSILGAMQTVCPMSSYLGRGRFVAVIHLKHPVCGSGGLFFFGFVF